MRVVALSVAFLSTSNVQHSTRARDRVRLESNRAGHLRSALSRSTGSDVGCLGVQHQIKSVACKMNQTPMSNTGWFCELYRDNCESGRRSTERCSRRRIVHQEQQKRCRTTSWTAQTQAITRVQPAGPCRYRSSSRDRFCVVSVTMIFTSPRVGPTPSRIANG